MNNTSSPFFRGDTTEEERRFLQTLSRFDRDGCSLLVTGNSKDIARQHMQCAFGGPDSAQILVTDTDPHRCLPQDVSPEDETVETIPLGYARSTTQSPSNAAVGDQRLERIRRDIRSAVDAVDDFKSLRVGIDSVERLVDSLDPVAVKRFIGDLSRYVKFTDDRIHFYVQQSADSALVQQLTQPVDTRIELRDERPEHRWHLPNQGITTDWVEL